MTALSWKRAGSALTAHADAAEARRDSLDAEDETLLRLTALRAAVAGQVSGAGADVGALRTAVASVFEFVAVLPEDCMGGDPPDEPDFSRLRVVPAVRAEMVAAAERAEPFTDVGELRRVPVPFAPREAPDDNQHETLVWKYMTQKTLRPL